MYRVKVLAVDDDPDILDVLVATLESDFDINTASTGAMAFEKIHKNMPDLLVLDYMLPDTTGPQICKALRKDPLSLHLPILMLTGKGEVDDKVAGLEAGADDYMVKPFAPQELLARIRMLVRRSNINLDANPLTRLPGNVSINSELEEKIKNKEKFAMLYIDLDNFKAVNDYYGFERGDKVIKETARLIINAVQEKGTVNDFIGHIGGDDYVVLSTIDRAEEIAKKIVTEFDNISPKFFDEKDSIKGFIETLGRDGQIHKFGFITISIGVITNAAREFTHTAQISSLGTEMKCLAKKFPQSKYIVDKRAL